MPSETQANPFSAQTADSLAPRTQEQSPFVFTHGNETYPVQQSNPYGIGQPEAKDKAKEVAAARWDVDQATAAQEEVAALPERSERDLALEIIQYGSLTNRRLRGEYLDSVA